MVSDYKKAMSSIVSNDQKFSQESQEHYQKIFAPTIKKYQSAARLTFAIIVIGLITLFMIMFFLAPNTPVWFAISFITLALSPVLSIFVVLFTHVDLKCPRCHRNIYSNLEIGNYCPECGTFGLKTDSCGKSPYCEYCRKRLIIFKGVRNFKKRACTYCGLVFSVKGF